MNKSRQTARLSSVFTFDATGKLTAMGIGTKTFTEDNVLDPATLVTTTRTLTINGTTFDLSANRSWTIAAGLSSFNTRTGDITLLSNDVTTALGFTPYNATNPNGYITGITSGNVTTALGYTPVSTTRTLTINGTAFDLSADRSWTIAAGLTSFNTRTGAITLTSSDVTTALGYTPYDSTNPSGYLTASTVLNTVLTPYVVGANTAISATDTIETAIEKLQGQVNARLSSITSANVTTALGYTPVTNARTLTINGTAFDLSADRSWTISAGTTLNGTGFVKVSGTTVSYDNSTYITSSGSITGSAGSAPTLTASGALTTQQGSGTLIYTHQITNPQTGLFPAVNNANSIITVNKHPGDYYSQLGFSSNGNLYYRNFNNVAINTSQGWQTIWTSSSLTNLNQLTNGPGYITTSTSGSFTVNGYLTVRGAGSSSSIYMSDDDEGQRELHCNSNRIGFLTQGGGWGSWCNDDGSWVSVSDITAYSDQRVKENIETITNAVTTVTALRGVKYNRIDDSKKVVKIGVIAQETQAVLPEVVQEQNDGMLSVSYGNMAGLFIEAFKEQQVQLMQQKAQIDELMEIVKTLKGL